MTQQPPQFYEFQGVRLFPADSRLIRLQDGAQFFIRPKERDFLVALLKKPQETVTYKELRREVWSEVSEVKAALPTMRETKRSVNRLLRTLTRSSKDIIRADVKEGYRFDARVTEGRAEVAQPEEAPSPLRVDEPAAKGVDASQTIEPLPHLQPSATGLPETEASSPPGSEAVQSPKPDEAPPKDETASHRIPPVSPHAAGRFASLFDGHHWLALMSCTLYALLYAVALLLEVAYQFDRYGATAMRLAPVVFLWIFATSLVGLSVDARWARQGRGNGLVAALCCFVGAALALYFVLCRFLPGSPITELSHQSQTAQGAYLKNILYFLPWAVVFILLPFHFVGSLRREMRAGRQRLVHALLLGRRRSVAPENAIYLRVLWLTLLLSGTAIFSLLLTFNLLTHIKPDLYMNMFTQLVLWRALLYFALGLQCLIWYAQSLNTLKRKCSLTSGSAATVVG